MPSPLPLPSRRSLVVRRAVVACAVFGALLAMGVVFWRQDLRYSLPTPLPAQLVQPPAGAPLQLPPAVAAARRPGQRPLLLHFYNPACPCSRFNRDHVRSLLQQFGAQVDFVAVVEAEAGADAASGLPIPHLVDGGGAIAAACGVYATPQAVLVTADGRLWFRGNYNLTRYCTAPATEFARLAVEALLAGRPRPVLPGAEVAYGCELPAAAEGTDGR